MNEYSVVIVETNSEQMLMTFHKIALQVNGINTFSESFYDNKDNFLAMVRKYQFKVESNELTRLS